MKRAEPHIAHGRTDHAFYPVAHFLSGFVGERNSKDRQWRHFKCCRKPGDSVGQNAGLAASGTGKNKHRTGIFGYCLALSVVQIIKNERHVHIR